MNRVSDAQRSHPVRGDDELAAVPLAEPPGRDCQHGHEESKDVDGANLHRGGTQGWAGASPPSTGGMIRSSITW